MDIISYDKEEIDSELTKILNKNDPNLKYYKNKKLTRYISKLSDQYNQYKETYKFPSKVKGKEKSITSWGNLRSS